MRMSTMTQKKRKCPANHEVISALATLIILTRGDGLESIWTD